MKDLPTEIVRFHSNLVINYPKIVKKNCNPKIREFFLIHHIKQHKRLFKRFVPLQLFQVFK